MLWQVEAPFWEWAVVSLLLGLGFTFFSGAVEAWLVDALTATGYQGHLETVFGRGQMVTGAGMLGGSIAGGFIAQQVSLGAPFVLRGAILLVMFVVAFRLMHDVGFTPEKGGRPLAEMRKIAANSIDYGWRVPAVKWLMVEALFTGGVGIYAFYALQPYLLELYGDPQAYEIAGLAAAIVAGAQILGGAAAPRIRALFRRRTSALLVTAGLSVVVLALIGAIQSFWVVIGMTSVGAALRRDDADPPDLHQRHDPVTPTGHDPLLRFDDVLDGGRLGAAGAGAGRGHIGICGLVSGLRRDRRVRPAVHRPLAKPERAGGHAGTDGGAGGTAGLSANSRK
jgi:hypothetical protein